MLGVQKGYIVCVVVFVTVRRRRVGECVRVDECVRVSVRFGECVRVYASVHVCECVCVSVES